MKRKCENCELTGNEAKERRVTRSMTREQVPKTRRINTGRKLRSTRTHIMDLPPELQLEIFSRLSVRDLCQRVAPVCKKWSILARHPSLRKELSFGKDISKSSALKLLHESPRLRRLSLRGRSDTDAILRRVRRSNRHIETLKMVRCRGAVRRREVNGDILVRILKECKKLCCLNIQGTLVKSFEFYTVLASLDERMMSFRIRSATKEGMLCYLKTRAKVLDKRRGSLNGVTRDVNEIIALMSQNTGYKNWSLIFND
ncbi:hypothetical protein B7P43_G02429 [Cryptotermes secundus]|uniref:F-box domain-containing protein n=1 Tax=Cryptotermes secundus TaxID=105785 RepID=A0A2J7QFI1_9NEOP|nr:hypothetical protein B7P43_G02429 [Cryptotermes secundus]